MIEAQRGKYAIAIAPAAIVDNASATALAVDTEGYDYAEMQLAIGATDIAMTALKVTESDTSDGSYTDVPGTTFGTAVDINDAATELPADDADNTLVVFQVNMLGRKRFLKLVATAGNGAAGTYLSAICRLTRGDMPSTNAEAGALAVVRV